MGRRKLSESEGLSDISSKSENFSDIPQPERPPEKRVKKKYKKSHKYKFYESEYSDVEDENIEKKKSKHKHRKHKSHRHRGEYYEVQSYRHLKRKHSRHSSSHESKSKRHKRRGDGEIDGRNRHSSQRKREREKRKAMIEDFSPENIEEQEEGSQWEYNEEGSDSNPVTSIKSEPRSQSRSRSRSRSPSQRSQSENRGQEDVRVKAERNEDVESWGQDAPIKKEENENAEQKETVNMGLSGKLTEDTNTYNGVVIKYSQPPEARKPKRRWRWYIFKGDEELPFLPLHRQSAYLIGRERKVADIPTDHPSCSKQHAVLQYRLVSYQREDGSFGRTVKPYILDLDSANGTYVNNRRIDGRRYVELLEKDVVKFGYSSREYVLLHEASKGSDVDAPDAGTDLSPISLLRSK